MISSKDMSNVLSNIDNNNIKTKDIENKIFKASNQKEFNLLLKQYFKTNKI